MAPGTIWIVLLQTVLRAFGNAFLGGKGWLAGTECCRTQASPQYTGRITDIIGHILQVIRLSVCRNACWQSWQQSVTGNRNLLHVLISWEILQSLAKIPEFYFYSEVQSDWGGWISSCWQKIKKQVCKTILHLCTKKLKKWLKKHPKHCQKSILQFIYTIMH